MIKLVYLLAFLLLPSTFSLKSYHYPSSRRLQSKHKLQLFGEEIEYTVQLKVPASIVNIYEQIFTSGKISDGGVVSKALETSGSDSILGLFKTGSTNSLWSSVLGSTLFLPAVAMATLFFIFWTALSPPSDSPYNSGPLVYDPKKSDDFYKKRPLLVLGRFLRIIWLTARFNINLVLDWKFNNLKKNEKDRAKEAVHVLTHLGPTFVKLGQALSIRTDIIPEAYALELKKLQDSVPPFNNALAKAIICKELKIKDLKEKFSAFSEKPVAAASIGQVYKATLHDGQEVAVKVQRPNILAEIGLDLHLLRLVAPIQVRLTNLVSGSKTDEADLNMGYALVDEWGRGLVCEVNYLQEARNTNQFVEAMKKRGLDAVTSPAVVESLSTNRVLVTEWVTGTRLDKDSSSDVPRLCGLALNAYLTMLLDTGVLHCDPHPGNLLRTTDGRLCILDWGMTLDLPNDLQYGLLEFIAHVNAGDFDKLPEDFVKLGATPPDKLEEVRKSGIAEGFALIMKQLGKGGGPAAITEHLRTEFKSLYGDLSDDELRQKAQEEMTKRRDVNDQQADPTSAMGISGAAGMMEMMSKKNRDIFKLPTYMLYVVRAFSTLEGIGLSIDPNYSIMQECYPYLAKRLMTDDSPRSRAALRNMIYRDGRLSTDKLIEFSDGFTSYTASTAHVDRDGAGAKRAQEALTDLILDSEGNMMQDLLLEGAAKMADSLVRVGIDTMKSSPGGQLVKLALKAPKTIVDNIVPHELRPLMLPFTLPYDISKAFVHLAGKNEHDTANIKSLRILWKSLEPRVRQQIRQLATKSLNSKEEQESQLLIPLSLMDSRAIRERLGLARKINDRFPVVLRLSRKLGANLLQHAAERMEAATKDRSHHSIDDDIDYEVELILTEQLGSLTSATAKEIAKALDVNGKTEEY